MADVPEHLFLQGPPPIALPESAQQFVDWETLKNKASQRSNKPFWIQHLEIPLKSLKEFKLDMLDPEIYKSMVFTKDGIDYVRWILNPEDTKHGVELREKLSRQGISFREGQHFIGYLTASRSCIVQDPVSGVVFSIKASTNETGGKWKNKKHPAIEAEAAVMMTDYLNKNEQDKKSDVLRFVPEPLAFTFDGADQAISIRQYSHFNDPTQEFRLIPFFTAVHETEGKRLAEINGSSNPLQFWADHLVTPAGTAIAEFVMRYGLILNSPHPQNFLIEVDRNNKPTGRIFFRDTADAQPQADIVERMPFGAKLLKFYKTLEQSERGNKSVRDLIHVAFHPLYNGTGPSWAPTWGTNWDTYFYHAVKMVAAKLFGATGDTPKTKIEIVRGADYWTWKLSLKGDPAYLNWLSKIGSREFSANSCGEFYKR
jgi:hypothetical protein